jgi:hypothetical protein
MCNKQGLGAFFEIIRNIILGDSLAVKMQPISDPTYRKC